MRAVVQRVKKGSVSIEEKVVSSIGPGLVILLGVGEGDTEADAIWLAEKIANLRIFPDAEDKLNLSLLNIGGEALVVSQFTLYGDCRHGRRPSFSEAALPDLASKLYKAFSCELKTKRVPVATGIFQANMLVEIANDGPVTLLLDTDKL